MYFSFKNSCIAFCFILLVACGSGKINNQPQNQEAVSKKEARKIKKVTKSDSKVTLLHKATEGKGINIVIIGDGYTAADIARGEYKKMTEKTYEHLFSVEPMISLKKYFNVYSVMAVSPEKIGGNTALGSMLGKKTAVESITGDTKDMNDKAKKYASKIPQYSIDNTQICVVMNTDKWAAIAFWDDTNYKDFLSVTYTSVYNSDNSSHGVEGVSFRYTIIHEVIGHGLAKLGDEYELENTNYERDIKPYLKWYKKKIKEGWWYQNVAFSEKKSESPWAQFLEDSRYKDEIGFFEGSFTHKKNIWRPSQTSIMRDAHNQGLTFNAPSRYAIYKWVMKIALDKEITYEEFVNFDLKK